uniref:Uncharacterized protein n=1 Tax=Oryza barthii TaxID=65489 RepID=A0A0D3F668_9ORYZ
MTSIEEGRIWLRVRERSGIQFDPIDSCCDEAEGVGRGHSQPNLEQWFLLPSPLARSGHHRPEDNKYGQGWW